MDLPKFKYHPDPIATGSFEQREFTCSCCEQVRPCVYVGPVYAEDDLEDSICPWCISSGLAHEKFDAEFSDIEGVGDYAAEALVPVAVQEEIAYRTPGFNGWQQERWLVHCNDAAVFLGSAGKVEIEALSDDALRNSLRVDSGMDESAFEEYFQLLDKDYGPTAYVFRCLHCAEYLGYSDCH